MSKKINVYGSNWIYNSRQTSFKDADIIIMPGGGDISTNLYNHKPIKGASYSPETDRKQWDIINEGIEQGKLIFGTCRGLQMLTARAGGWLIQDVSHPSKHIVKTKDGEFYSMNSCHHQMCYPYDLPENEYDVLSWTRQLSSKHIIQGDIDFKEFPKHSLDEDGVFKEPEVIWYPKINALGAQGHFEWGAEKNAMDFINNLIIEKLNNK